MSVRLIPVSTRGAQSPTSRETFWRRAIAECDRTGISQVQFCQRRGLSPASLYWWRSEIRRRAARREALSRGGASALPRRFLPVRVVEASALRDGAPVEIVLCGSRRVLVRAGFELDVLRSVVTLLESLPC